MKPAWWGRRWTFILLGLGAVVILVLVGTGAWMATRGQDDGTPTVVSSSPTATTEPTQSGEAASATAVSSPVDASLPPAGSLPAMLQLAPDRLGDDSLPLPFVASYADIESWMAQQGIARPSSLSDPSLHAWERQLGALALPTSLATRGTEPIWQETYGFDLTQVNQVLMVGPPPDTVMILTGEFNADALQNAWVRSGYQPVKIEGMTIWSLYPGDIIDLSSPASRPALGSLNNVVLLDDGTLLAAAKLSRLQSVLKVRNGDRSSLAANTDIQHLLSPIHEIENLVSAEIAKGELLESVAVPKGAETGTDAPSPVSEETNTPIRTSTGERAPQMPEVRLTLFGLRGIDRTGAVATPASPVASTPMVADDAGRYEMVMVFLFSEEKTAPTAARVLQTRLQHDRSSVTDVPFTNRLANPHIQAATGHDRTDVLVLHAQLVDGPGDWVRIVETRDLEFAFWVQSP